MKVCGPSGACGTIIFWKQVGHSIWVPDCDESHLICWPHTGQAYLNSLMIHGNISYFHAVGNGLFNDFCFMKALRGLWLRSIPFAISKNKLVSLRERRP